MSAKLLKKIFYILPLLFIPVLAIAQTTSSASTPNLTPKQIATQLKISYLRVKQYPGSAFVIEQTLTPSSTYARYVVSYLSDGIRINGLLTVPSGEKPINGWPGIIFNHGYVKPEIYTTEQRYAAYVDYFARNGYVVFKPDYRGHAESEGDPEGVYYSPAYTIDVMNALASLKKYPEVNPDKIGMWGHSMGGSITLKSLVINTSSVKAAVIWGGVVGSYTDIMYHWPDNNPKVPYVPSTRDVSLKQNYRKKIIANYGTPISNPSYWKTIDPTYFIKDIKTPIQLNVGTKDLDVPPAFSYGFYNKMKSAKKTVQLYTYKNANHNISAPNFEKAMKNSLAFFDKYLK